MRRSQKLPGIMSMIWVHPEEQAIRALMVAAPKREWKDTPNSRACQEKISNMESTILKRLSRPSSLMMVCQVEATEPTSSTMASSPSASTLETTKCTGSKQSWTTMVHRRTWSPTWTSPSILDPLRPDPRGGPKEAWSNTSMASMRRQPPGPITWEMDPKSRKLSNRSLICDSSLLLGI